MYAHIYEHTHTCTHKNVASNTEELNFKFYLIFNQYINSYTCLVATVLNDATLREMLQRRNLKGIASGCHKYVCGRHLFRWQ